MHDHIKEEGIWRWTSRCELGDDIERGEEKWLSAPSTHLPPAMVINNFSCHPQSSIWGFILQMVELVKLIQGQTAAE